MAVYYQPSFIYCYVQYSYNLIYNQKYVALFLPLFSFYVSFWQPFKNKRISYRNGITIIVIIKHVSMITHSINTWVKLLFSQSLRNACTVTNFFELFLYNDEYMKIMWTERYTRQSNCLFVSAPRFNYVSFIQCQSWKFVGK